MPTKMEGIERISARGDQSVSHKQSRQSVTDKTNGSTSRGRKRTNISLSTSPSRSASSASPTPRRDRHKHRKQDHLASPEFPAAKLRRRSDVAIDETRRGRSLTRSVSPEKKPSDAAARHHDGHHRKRKPSPSRSRSRGGKNGKDDSGSPKLRRQHTRSRSRSRSRSRDRKGWKRGGPQYRGYERRLDEGLLRREEMEREGGRGRFDDVIVEDEDDYGDGNSNGDGYGNGIGNGQGRQGNHGRERDGRRGGYGYDRGGTSDGRLGGTYAEDSGSGTGEVKFKGRGSMKYREHEKKR
ncbi:MAG: serine arginine-rich splicing factor [Icmadophila ericetorum]|nr:serine arginine-rich splicing factor [Icmadophila ericetorum]